MPGYRHIQKTIRANIVPAFADPSAIGGWLRASTEISRQPDVWGTLFALYLGVLDRAHAKAARKTIADAVRSGTITLEGGVRQVPTDMDFSKTTAWERSFCAVNTYQNGGYWHTATGWLVEALWSEDRQLALQIFNDMIVHVRAQDFRKGPGHGAPWEVFGPNGTAHQKRGLRGFGRPALRNSEAAVISTGLRRRRWFLRCFLEAAAHYFSVMRARLKAEPPLQLRFRRLALLGQIAACFLTALVVAAAEPSRELIRDPHYQNGLLLLEPKPDKRIVYGEAVDTSSTTPPVWDLAQWSSNFPLEATHSQPASSMATVPGNRRANHGFTCSFNRTSRTCRC